MLMGFRAITPLRFGPSITIGTTSFSVPITVVRFGVESEEAINGTLSVYPNPSSGEYILNFDLNQRTSGIIEVADELVRSSYKNLLQHRAVTFIKSTRLEAEKRAVSLDNPDRSRHTAH